MSHPTPDVQKLINRSSLGTRAARAARRSVPPETGKRLVRAAATGRYQRANHRRGGEDSGMTAGVVLREQ